MEQNERDLIYQKLSILQDYYRELQSLEYITFEEYTGNNINIHSISLKVFSLNTEYTPCQQKRSPRL